SSANHRNGRANTASRHQDPEGRSCGCGSARQRDQVPLYPDFPRLTHSSSRSIMNDELPKVSVAETLANKIVALKPGVLPDETRRKCEDLLIDVVGLCVTARNEDYVKAALSACDDDGPCTVIGHGRTLTASGAAFVNGTAAHGEDFDDTFEGGPVHAGAVIVPAVLAACERAPSLALPRRRDGWGPAALVGIA